MTLWLIVSVWEWLLHVPCPKSPLTVLFPSLDFSAASRVSLQERETEPEIDEVFWRTRIVPILHQLEKGKTTVLDLNKSLVFTCMLPAALRAPRCPVCFPLANSLLPCMLPTALRAPRYPACSLLPRYPQVYFVISGHMLENKECYRFTYPEDGCSKYDVNQIIIE